MATKKPDLREAAHLEAAETVRIDGLSVSVQIKALKIGETWSRAYKIDGNAATKDFILATLDRMRNATTSAITNASKLGFEYTREAISTRTASHDVLCLVAVTRTA